jgi:dUTP pyrophosphatase
MNHYYELEICPLSEDVARFYENTVDLPKDNAGFDMYSMEDSSIYETPEFIKFGVKMRLLKVVEDEKIDSHYWLLPRSSIYKTGLIMANSVGVIDASYRGEVKAPVWSMTGTSKVNKGDRLFQVVAPDMGWIRNVRIVESLPNTDRGEGGFGSTGK